MGDVWNTKSAITLNPAVHIGRANKGTADTLIVKDADRM